MLMEQNTAKIAQAVRILHGLGLVEVFGHVSARADTQSFHVLGTCTSPAELSPLPRLMILLRWT